MNIHAFLISWGTVLLVAQFSLPFKNFSLPYGAKTGHFLPSSAKIPIHRVSSYASQHPKLRIPRVVVELDRATLIVSSNHELPWTVARIRRLKQR